jgi:hypothetical protein
MAMIFKTRSGSGGAAALLGISVILVGRRGWWIIMT